MISLDNTLISSDLKEVFFSCDLEKCKGACCIEGDAGAPLEEEEISQLEDHREAIFPFMTVGGIEEVRQRGVFDYDAQGRYVTPLIHGKECAYIRFEEGIARCAIEAAYQQKKIPFSKPLSCHLYPVRISSTPTGEVINVHSWSICDPAQVKGQSERCALYVFLQEALIRKYGAGWYEKLVALIRPGD